MKKLFYLAFAVALVTGLGCAITNYELITSNNQSGPVNTNGKALIQQSVQVATIWADGTDCITWYVDQAANGNRTLTNYNLFVPAGSGLSYFQDYLYCNPGWNGCSSITADDPEVGDVDIYDYRYNTNCSGARSLSFITSTTRYYGECGRLTTRPSLSQRLEVMLTGHESSLQGKNGMLYNVGPQNTSIKLTNDNGQSMMLPITGHTTLWAKLGGGHMQAALFATNSALVGSVRSLADWTANMATYHSTKIELTYAGVPITFGVAGNRNGPISSSKNISSIANRF